MFGLSEPIAATFLVYVAAMVGTGVWAYGRTHTFADFALGGRRLRAFVAALSAGASDMSGWLFLALPGAVYAAGLGASWIAVGLVIGTYLNWLFVAPRLRTYTERAGNAVSLSAYLEERFEDRTRMLRMVSAAVTLVFFTVYVASGLVAGGLLFEHVFDVRFGLGVSLTALVIVVYSCLGGFLAVSLTHVLQGTLMFLALLVLPIVGIEVLGGFGNLRDSLDNKTPDLLNMGAKVDYLNGQWSAGGSLGAIAIISLLAWGLGYFGQPHILARFMGIRSTRAVPAARRLGTGWVIVVLAGATLVGLVGIAQPSTPLHDPQTVYIVLSRTLLNPWVAGGMLIAVLSAIMSTADSQLLVSSVALTEDFYRAFLNRRASDRALVWFGRGAVVVVTLVAFVIALRGGGLLGIVGYAWAGFGAAFGPVVLLSLYWPRMTWAGAMAGIVSGAATVLLWKKINPLLGPFESNIYEMVPGVLVATAAALLFGRFVGRPPKRAFWRMPGGGVSQLMLTPFLTHAPVGIAVLDTDLRYVWVNEPLDRQIPLGRRLGRRMTEVLPKAEAEAFEERMLKVLDSGVPVMDYEHRGVGDIHSDRGRAISASFFAMKDRHGRIVGVWYMVIDITQRWRAQERLALLNDAASRIGSTLDVTRTAQELADEAVPSLADFVAVDLLDSVMRGEEPAPGPVGMSPVIRRAGQQSVREGCPEATLAVGETVRRAPASPVTRCLLESRTLVERNLDYSTSPWVTEDETLGASLRDYGFRSVMVVPVRARGVTLGVATFARSRRLGPFEDDDVRLAEELVSRAALSVDNARRFTRERTAARSMQRYLLPQDLSGGSALEVASWYLPADAPSGVGGDWFDAIPLSGARVALVVGDVVGHGINAAATMGRLRTAVRTLANLDLPPDELLAHLDDLVIGLMGEYGDEEPAAFEGAAAGTAFMGATCLYAIYDPVSRKCTLARAGHLLPVVVGPHGGADILDLPAGPPLGLGYLPFECVELELAEGSLIALYTDGLIESFDRDIDVGLARLSEVLATPRAALEETGRKVIDTLLTGPPADDAALLLARTRVLDPNRVVSWKLPSDPAAVAHARSLAAQQLTEWDMPDLTFTTELIVSELVTNAIRHAVGPVELRLIRDRDLICEVSDASSTSPRLRHARTTDEGGRGLLIVAQLTRRWGTRYTETGKIIWAEQSLSTGTV
ncbi:sodium/proline symporter [Streptomyces pluripotens]|uniref:Sodium/proline symporter n=1 Tax=Streptomyces pluripotens TaxID=1355015 RepID=A0A221P816_9ACTN|nr:MULTISPECIES: sodium/proline symporter PutP [Streptomyces]ARP74193.1 sodium/proline symporter [Streptomyces pluripotens]ASN28463.1 sodium/proline symporter [Streptomyces pluripotens]KIE26063.1 PAS/PAC sensor protein [Streptomyces sp. MUSC 125]MCH0557178.1 sodium/proline symporter PutP [Streptomyces sp. MUM 16J]